MDYSIAGSVLANDIATCGNSVTTMPVSGAYVVAEHQNGLSAYSSVSDENGNFSIPVPLGDYNLQVIHPLPYWESCEDTLQISFTNESTIMLNSIELNKSIDCIDLEIDITTPRLRRCFNENYYFVSVCNQGNALATAVEMEMILDPYLSYLSSSLPISGQADNILYFNLNDLAPNECIQFGIEVNVSCTAPLGYSHCTEAVVTPNEDCFPAAPNWDGSSVSVIGACETDTIRFDVTNAGTGDMTEPRGYIIWQNASEYETGQVQLIAGQTQSLSLPADGSTWRIEVNQSVGHPGQSYPSSSVESCTPDSNPSTGFINQFPLDDLANFIDIDCVSNIGAFDPNDKQATPEGYGDQHYIRPNTRLDYLVRFQNTGTDTAFNIIVRDTLSEYLRPASLRMLQSSHPYTYDIQEGNILIVTYENILLPDSNVNEPASNGFFK
ncbi:MAG: carboxypeptidase-like regulatory domain-containing protein, partial [Bacteroidota bacterium]